MMKGLLDRNIIWCDASIRGGRERGEIWHEEGKMLSKKNTFQENGLIPIFLTN